MLHNANIYIAIGREVMRFLYMQMLNTFEKTKTKKRKVIFYKDNN